MWTVVNVSAVGLLIITNAPDHLEILLIGETGCEVCRNPLLSSQFFCKSETVLKNKLDFKNNLKQRRCVSVDRKVKAAVTHVRSHGEWDTHRTP